MSRDTPSLRINDDLEIPGQELEFRFSRSSGPGGQNVNKLNTRVQMRWNVLASRSLSHEVRQRLIARNSHRMIGGEILQIECQRYRTQRANKQACLRELAQEIEQALLRPKTRKKTRPTRASKERRLAQKKEQSQKKSSRRFRPRLD